MSRSCGSHDLHCQADAAKPDQQELINVEGRLINYLVDCITSGRERDQAYAAVLLARLLTHVRFYALYDLVHCVCPSFDL